MKLFGLECPTNPEKETSEFSITNTHMYRKKNSLREKFLFFFPFHLNSSGTANRAHSKNIIRLYVILPLLFFYSDITLWRFREIDTEEGWHLLLWQLWPVGWQERLLLKRKFSNLADKSLMTAMEPCSLLRQ